MLWKILSFFFSFCPKFVKNKNKIFEELMSLKSEDLVLFLFLFIITIWAAFDLGLSIRQIKQFEDVTLEFGKAWWAFSDVSGYFTN